MQPDGIDRIEVERLPSPRPHPSKGYPWPSVVVRPSEALGCPVGVEPPVHGSGTLSPAASKARTTVGGDVPSGEAERVVELELDLDPLHFPEVMARVHALDPRGREVEGMNAADLVVTEDGSPVQADVARMDTGDSELWDWLARAAERRPTVTVFVTDGVGDDPSPEVRASVAQGPPGVMVGVRGPTPDLREMAAATGGVIVEASEPGDIVEAVRGFVEGRKQAAYEISWGSAPPTIRGYARSPSGSGQATSPWKAPTTRPRSRGPAGSRASG